MCRLVLAFVVYMAVGIGYRVTVLGVSGIEVSAFSLCFCLLRFNVLYISKGQCESSVLMHVAVFAGNTKPGHMACPSIQDSGICE